MKRAGVVGSALGTALLATLFFRGPAPQPNASAQSSNSSNRSVQAGQRTQKKRLPEDGPWKASRQHFAGAQSGKECPALSLRSGNQSRVASTRGTTLVLASGEEIEITNPREDLWCIPNNDESVQAMIAIAPDPVHTHMALVFDRTIEAIQLAADKMHYVVDQYWLPWDSEPNPQWTDYESRQKATLREQEKQEQPGLLMFRWNGETGAKDEGQSKVRVLYVFLVSDTSTSGINGTQFSNAAEYAQEVLCVTRGCPKAGNIRIMGPTFSGSLASLRQLGSQRPEAFTVYSGTVSSATAI